MRPIRSFILMAGWLTIASSCVGHVTVLDKEQCIDEGSLGAHCAHQYSAGVRDPGKEEWDNERFGWFCMNPDDTVETKKEWEEVCSIKGVSCDLRARKTVQQYIHRGYAFRDRMRAHLQLMNPTEFETHGIRPIQPAQDQ
jgi:hypothetical protein